MGWFGSEDRLFENQFEPSGDGFTYRKWGTGPAYIITAGQREEFGRQFRSSRRWNTALLYAGLIVALGTFVGWSYWRDIDPESSAWKWSLAVLMLLFMVPFVMRHMRAYTAPERQLSGGRAAMPALDKNERKKLALHKLSYWQLLFVPLFPLLLLQGRNYSLDVWHGWGRLWWVLFIGFAVLAIIQAYRKWSYEQRR